MTDRPNFRVHPVKRDFYFLFLTRTTSSMTFWGEMKFPPNITRRIHSLKQGQRGQKKKKFVWLCLSGLGDLRSVFSVSLLQIRRLPPNNLYIAFLVSFLLIAYCLHGSIPRQISTGFYSFAMQVISMRNILKGSFSLSLKLSFNPLKWSRVFSKCCWL